MKMLRVAVLPTLLVVAAHAQTTGVPGINDYTVAGMLPGSTSCLAVAVPGGGATPFTISAGAPGLMTFRFFSPCPCTPCSFPMLASPCAIPATACGAGTNQSLDLTLFCPLLGPVPGITDAAGISTAVVVVPAGIAFSTQAIVFDPACGSPTFGGLILVTQGYMVST